jgi:hypothetical protein
MKISEVCLGKMLKTGECRHWVTVSDHYIPLLSRKEIIVLCNTYKYPLPDHFKDDEKNKKGCTIS